MADKNQFAELLKKPEPLAPAAPRVAGGGRGGISAATSIQR